MIYVVNSIFYVLCLDYLGKNGSEIYEC